MSPEVTHQGDMPIADLPSPSTRSTPPAKCEATTLAGKPCPTKPVLGLRHCYAHAPELAEERHLVRVRGGLEATRQRALPPDTPLPSLASAVETRRLVEETIQQVRTGALPPAVANSVLYAVSVGLKLAELELSSQVAALEQELLMRRRGQ